MTAQFLLIVLAAFASEDLACIATGVWIAQGKMGYEAGIAACFTGILLGDLLLFLTGRIIGRPALRWRPLARFLSAEHVERASSWFLEKGMVVVFLSRFTPGLRLPAYFAAGLLRTRLWTFTIYFSIASAVWTPLLVSASAALGESTLRAALAHRNQGLAAFLLAFATVFVIHQLASSLLTETGRRKAVGFWRRKLRWEFWPSWAAYLPLLPYLLLLALRHRSLTLFTAANPGISSGGFAGESKSEILRHLSRVEGAVAEFEVISSSGDPSERVMEGWGLFQNRGWNFPVVLKPDIGERGAGVKVIRSASAFEAYLRKASGDVILQRYVPGLEFGVFYYRYPGETRGRIFSITEKLFPAVTGNGRATLEELILRDPRAVCLAAAYCGVAVRPLSDIPASGESVQLVEIGSHCRGAVFRNGIRLWTPQLEATIDCISQAHPGFFFGRFDIRAASVEAFKQGGPLQVIELNGVSAEAAHIYDPAVSLLDAYRVLARQWKIAFEIGSIHRARGQAPMTFAAFVNLLWQVFTRRKAIPSSALSSMTALLGAR